jgi:hypothetical protein
MTRNGTKTVGKNVINEETVLGAKCVTTQKKADLIYTTAET